MKGTIISFIGTDGAGKSTIISELKNRLEQEQQAKVKTVYFGWKPFLPTTKLLSFILKKNDYQIADRMNRKDIEEKNRFNLFQEMMLGYYYIEYLSRYIFQLRLFSRNSIILVDRYFYDMYAHYKYAEHSRIFPFLLKLMPKPDLAFFLTVDTPTAQQRKPEMDLKLLQEHYQRYQRLSTLVDAKTIQTNQEIELSLNEIHDIIKKSTKK